MQGCSKSTQAATAGSRILDNSLDDYGINFYVFMFIHDLGYFCLFLKIFTRGVIIFTDLKKKQVLALLTFSFLFYFNQLGIFITSFFWLCF